MRESWEMLIWRTGYSEMLMKNNFEQFAGTLWKILHQEPRIFPFTAELRSILEEQEQATRELERERGVFIPFLFHHDSEPFAKFYEKRGYWKPTRYFLSVWKKAASAAGLAGRIRHDFRRTAVQDLIASPIMWA